ncbi:MAG: prolyl oligopeptidase family serine peptidase, partial [Erysipelothrix sp.]
YFGVDQTASSPFDNIEQMWEQSPLKHAQNIKTPLLFIHSEEDYRCPIEQGMQLFTAIKVNGVETRFVWIRGENHDLSRSGRPQSRVKRLEEITNWMNSHLK